MAVLTFDFLTCVGIRDLQFGEGNPLAALTEEGTEEMVEVVQVEKGYLFFSGFSSCLCPRKLLGS